MANESLPPKVSRRLFVTATAAAALAGTTATGSAEADPRPAQAADDLTLWYDEPAAKWESESLPIGNGALGANIFGGVAAELLQFNEKTLWTGGPGAPGYNFGNWTAPRPGALAEVQQRISHRRQGRPGVGREQAGPAQEQFRRLPGLRRPAADVVAGTRRGE